MTQSPDTRISNMGGDVDLPRKNGELVFEAPWEGRAFGLAVALRDSGHYHWWDFRERLIAEIASAEQGDGSSSYYERWLASLEKLVIAQGLINRKELDQRTVEYSSGQGHDAPHHPD